MRRSALPTLKRPGSRNADWLYRSQAEPIFKEWTGIIERALTASGRTGPKEHITRVSTSAEAQLIVSLIGVRNPKTAVNRPADRCLMFLLDRGPRLSVEQFARIPRTYRPRTFQAKRLEGPSESSPAWRFEAASLTCSVPRKRLPTSSTTWARTLLC
jgi:hypothetical protein